MTLTHLQTTYLSCFFESLFLGVHSVLIAVVIWLWSSKKTAHKVHYLLYVCLIIMFIVACAHITFGVATWILPNTLNKKLASERASLLLAIFQFIFGDIVIIWRLWVVWNKNLWIIVVPVCISSTAFGFGFATAKGSTDFQIISPSLLVANFMLCTGLIIGRILYISMRSRNSSENIFTSIRKSPYKGIIFFLAESGFIYTAFHIASLIMYKRQSPLLGVLLNLMVPVLGILPTTIVVLAALDALPGRHVEKTFEDLKTAKFQAGINMSTTQYSTNTAKIETLEDGGDLPKGSWKGSAQSFSGGEV